MLKHIFTFSQEYNLFLFHIIACYYDFKWHNWNIFVYIYQSRVVTLSKSAIFITDVNQIIDVNRHTMIKHHGFELW